MGEEKSRDITGITVRYSDGSTKEIQSGRCCSWMREARKNSQNINQSRSSRSG